MGTIPRCVTHRGLKQTTRIVLAVILPFARNCANKASFSPYSSAVYHLASPLRALNRSLQWQLPTDGPKTLNGLLLEQLETIPSPGTAVRVGPYQFEVLQIADNAIRTVRARAPAEALSPASSG